MPLKELEKYMNMFSYKNVTLKSWDEIFRVFHSTGQDKRIIFAMRNRTISEYNYIIKLNCNNDIRFVFSSTLIFLATLDKTTNPYFLLSRMNFIVNVVT